MLKEGDRAPGFTLIDDQGREVRLEDLRGRWVVLYFYPKDDTPGCTTEACGFRDVYGEIRALGAEILGVSPDPIERHQRFKSKYNLPFPLLSDPDHRVAEAYGAWGTKKSFGKEVEGILRSTFLIDPEGRIARIWRRVRPKGHNEQVLEALRALKEA